MYGIEDTKTRNVRRMAMAHVSPALQLASQYRLLVILALALAAWMVPGGLMAALLQVF